MTTLLDKLFFLDNSGDGELQLFDSFYIKLD